MKAKALATATALFLLLGIAPFDAPRMNFAPNCYAMTPLTRLEMVSEVKADQSRVSLLDLCNTADIPEDWKSVMAKVDIGEAPAPGGEKFIKSDQLRPYIERFFSTQGYDPSRIELIVPDRITITRQSFRITREQIEAIYKDFILSKSQWNPQDVVVRSVLFPDPPELPEGAMTYEVIANPRERFIGNVSLTIQFFIDGVKQRTLRVGGKVDLFQNIVHAVRPMKRNDIVTDADVELQKINISDSPDRFAAQTDQVVGKRLIRDVGLRQPIAVADLDSPLAMKRGKTVTIIYQQPGIKVTAKGQARGDGSVGSTIGVLNVMTNRVVQCQVVDEETVRATP